MLATLLQTLTMLATLARYDGCTVVDWALDDARDNGAASVAVACTVGTEERPVDLLIGPDLIVDDCGEF